MSYIGNEPIVSATRTITEVTATAGQTVFTANGGYTVGYIDVFLNGAQLQTVDFTATNGTTITLTEAAQVGDVIRLVAWGTFQSANLNGAGLLDGTVTAAKFASGQTPSFNGINFPASQVSSAGANTLDDYEEGTFTPNLSRDGTAPTIAYSFRQGQYTKIGNQVTVSISAVVSSVSSAGSGSTIITGLPFASSTASYSGQGSIGYNDAAVNTLSGSWISVTNVYFRNGTRSQGNDAGGWTAGYLNMTITYLTN